MLEKRLRLLPLSVQSSTTPLYRSLNQRQSLTSEDTPQLLKKQLPKFQMNLTGYYLKNYNWKPTPVSIIRTGGYAKSLKSLRKIDKCWSNF